jgi:outer membrane murein-binding lipoprotein Lpp
LKWEFEGDEDIVKEINDRIVDLEKDIETAKADVKTAQKELNTIAA